MTKDERREKIALLIINRRGDNPVHVADAIDALYQSRYEVEEKCPKFECQDGWVYDPSYNKTECPMCYGTGTLTRSLTIDEVEEWAERMRQTLIKMQGEGNNALNVVATKKLAKGAVEINGFPIRRKEDK